MPYREHEHYEKCGEPRCAERATGRCVRCGRPLCDAHIPKEDDRCSDCELLFWERVGPPGDRTKLASRLASRQTRQTRRNLLTFATLLGLGAGLVFVGGWLSPILLAVAGWLAPLMVITGVLIGAAGLFNPRESPIDARRTRFRKLRRKFLTERKRPELPPKDD